MTAAADRAMSQGFAVVDAHQHFWDPTRNYHPWLCDEPPIPFRYGDYRALRRPYLPPQYRADAAPFEVTHSVYVETEWDPHDPAGDPPRPVPSRPRLPLPGLRPQGGPGAPYPSLGAGWSDNAHQSHPAVSPAPSGRARRGLPRGTPTRW